MNTPKPSITVDVDPTNPGQFFACCGLLELADRLWPGAEGWFEDQGRTFLIACAGTIEAVITAVQESVVSNTMTPQQLSRLEQLSAMKKSQRGDELESEKKNLEALRRELPIVLSGPVSLRIDWFCDGYAGGSRFKTWAGQQSVLEITKAMHGGIDKVGTTTNQLWKSVRGVGLPFNFDSDLGAQGSALDVGFSFDPLTCPHA